jgi:hypothetical protein
MTVGVELLNEPKLDERCAVQYYSLKLYFYSGNHVIVDDSQILRFERYLRVM